MVTAHGPVVQHSLVLHEGGLPADPHSSTLHKGGLAAHIWQDSDASSVDHRVQLRDHAHITSRFWVEKGGRKHRKNICVFLAESYGPGLKT